MKNWSWNPLTWVRYFSTHKQSRSWIGHGISTAVAGLVCSFVGLIWSIPMILGYTIGTVLMGSYYIFVREPLDLVMHMRENHDDVSFAGDEGPLHFEMDRVADSVGPGCVAGSAVIAFLLSLF